MYSKLPNVKDFSFAFGFHSLFMVTIPTKIFDDVTLLFSYSIITFNIYSILSKGKVKEFHSLFIGTIPSKIFNDVTPYFLAILTSFNFYSICQRTRSLITDVI